jgi:hypothetical protein
MGNLHFDRRRLLWLIGAGGTAALTGYFVMRRDQSVPPRVGVCEIDPERLAPLKESTERCGPDNPTDEWQHSCIYPRAVAYSCGGLVRPGGPNEHDHDPEEIPRCRRLATDAGLLCRGLELNASEGRSALAPFFITANRHAQVPDRLTPEFVRVAFGGTIYPCAEIVIEPLEERGRGWVEIAMVESDNGELTLTPDARARYTQQQLEELRQATRTEWEGGIGRWRAVLNWFRTNDELHGGAFVLIGEIPLSRTNLACIFPRLILGITRAGSLVGVCGHAVHT